MTGADRPEQRLYGRRQGHKLRDGQQRLFDELLPRLRLEPAAPLGEPSRLFPDPVDEVFLEIGFGGAEHMIALARENPHLGLIGCEPFVNGIAKALAAVDEHGLRNVRLHDGDAEAVLDALPEACLGRVYLLYPDPWPKLRHHKRRFVRGANLDRLARVIRPGGELRFASDWADYADWTLRRATHHPDFEWTAERADDWRTPWAGWPGTRYEAKAKREGRTPTYLVFRRR